jgi:WD40 repeat protein
MHREPSETLAYRLNLHRVIFRSLCCILFLLLAGCASSTASSPTGTAGASTPTTTPTMAPTATPTPNIPTLSTALLTYKGHSKAALGFAWSPDGKEIVSGSDDGTVQMWDTKTGKRLWNYNTGTYVFAVAWSPDGKEIASASQDGTVQIWLPHV